MAKDSNNVDSGGKGTGMLGAHISSGSDVMPESVFGYTVLGVLGHGAGTTVYVVTDPSTGQVYSLKHIVTRSDKDGRVVAQLENEYEIGQRAHHAGLRRSVELKVARNLVRKVVQAALVMEFFDGVPLDQSVVGNIAAATECFVQTAQALQALHRTGYVHCDLKPNNILLGADEQVKVIDLGQACPIGTVKPRIQGTPDYIAPEQVRCEPVTVRTDVFNLGATLYWVLTAKHLPTLYTLHKGPNSFLLDAHVPSPNDLRADVPMPLSNLVMECVRTNPAKRPADMGELIRRLETIQFLLSRPASQPRRGETAGVVGLTVPCQCAA